ncbi:MAG: hypothetical protein RLZZ165_1146 [Bacteroidota bacterium]
MKRHFILLGLLLLVAARMQGQQDPMYTHYMYNTQVVNPAYAGSREALTFTGLVRAQWVDFPGRPASQTLSLNTPVVSEHFGVGLSYTSEQFGKGTSVSNGQVDFAFRFYTSKRSQLAMGLKGSMVQFSENMVNLFLKDPVDPYFPSGTRGRIAPNVGTGLYFKHDRYYIGLSIPKLLENRFQLDSGRNGTFLGFRQRHYYGIFGMRLDLENRIQFIPTALVKYTLDVPLQVDLTASLLIRDQLMTGLMYRHRDAVGMMFGFHFTEQLLAGYSFDWSLGIGTGRYNSGSHEFMLRYDFLFRNSQKTRSSRYF